MPTTAPEPGFERPVRPNGQGCHTRPKREKTARNTAKRPKIAAKQRPNRPKAPNLKQLEAFQGWSLGDSNS